MSIDEFWKLYNRDYRRFISQGFSVVDYPLAGDTGFFRISIYINENGKYCVDRTIERCNIPSHREYDSEELAVEKILSLCDFYTWHKYEA